MTEYIQSETVFPAHLAQEICLLPSQLVHSLLYHRLQEQLMKLR